MDIESQLPIPEEVDEDAWSRDKPEDETDAETGIQRVKFDHNRLKRLGITVVKDWDEAALSKRGLVGIRKNAFVNHEGKALKVHAEPAVDSEEYVPLKLCRQRVVKAAEEVEALKKSCVYTIQAIEGEVAQEQVHQLANYAHSFEALKKQSMRCIQHYKTKLRALQEDYEETSRREKALSNQLVELREVHEKHLEKVRSDVGDEHSSTVAKLRGSFETESNDLRMANEDILGQSLRRIQALRKEFQFAMEALKQEKEVAETQVAHLRKLVLLSPKVVKKALMLEGEMSRLRQSIQDKAETENKLKQKVRKWEDDFQKQHGKEPTKADLRPLKDTFIEISQLERTITETSQKIKALQEKHDKLITTSDISHPNITGESGSVTLEQPEVGQPSSANIPTAEEMDRISVGDEQLPEEEESVLNVSKTTESTDEKGTTIKVEKKAPDGNTAHSEESSDQVSEPRVFPREDEEKAAPAGEAAEAASVETAEDGEAETKEEAAAKKDGDRTDNLEGQTSMPTSDNILSTEQSTGSLSVQEDEKARTVEEAENDQSVDEKKETDESGEGSGGKTESSSKEEDEALDPTNLRTSDLEATDQANSVKVQETSAANKEESSDAKKTASNSKAGNSGKAKGKEKGRDGTSAGGGAGETQDNGNASAIAKRYLNKVKATEKKLKATENKLRETKSKMTRLEKELMETQRQLNSSTSGGKGGHSGDSSKLAKEMEHMKKKHTKELTEKEKELKRSFNKTLQEKDQAVKAAEAARGSTEKSLAEKAKEVELLTENVASLQSQIAEAQAKIESEQAGSSEMKEEMVKLEGILKEEQALRKKYFNMMEDMKGKIRVFARCRPMAAYEKEKKCSRVVEFPDETTLTVETEKGTKEFVYDHCFGPESTQEEIFEDTRNLIQSSLDGFNVCVFAYGQTGSGKTFTMVGSEEHPGIVRRTISEIFGYIERNKGKMKLNVKLYMVELYRDNLLDLLRDKKKKEQKLEIKKDKKGTVFVKNATIVNVQSAQELFKLFDTANANRKTASTKMNAASSRSHLVFSLILENTNVATRKTNVGKISLVDLAGSERADKTGATDETLKEAMSINKSLSALGDVISALSTGEKHIPYRNNTLTQLMSDSLGGNAKTLMFVNVSPADYNAVSHGHVCVLSIRSIHLLLRASKRLIVLLRYTLSPNLTKPNDGSLRYIVRLLRSTTLLLVLSLSLSLFSYHYALRLVMSLLL